MARHRVARVDHRADALVRPLGDEVSPVRPGDRVIVPFQISCGRCDRGRHGLTASCRANPGAMYGLAPFGGPWGGFLADVVRVPWADAMLLPLPAGVRLVTGRVNARAAIPAVLDLVAAGRFDPGAVTDAVVAWDDAGPALVDGRRKLVVQRVSGA